ncbi:MAG: autotransporter domain-containing protein [Proteobacteria bacterium]|nr:autotransporter domain-containing protein [Pseudomonadota bacterium]
MPRIRLLATSLALALCATTAAQAQQFSGFFSFGDSLSDAGNIAALNGLPPGFGFTTNPDPNSVELIAKTFGFNLTNSSGGGTDFAYGGACVEQNSATFTCGPSAGIPFDISITGQVAAYIGAGKVDPNALYTMWGGANDLFTYAALAGGGFITGNQALVGSATAAGTETGLINALQTAGARNIIVFNLPNIAVTPDAAASAQAAGQAAAGAWLATHPGDTAGAAAAAQAAGAQVIQSLTGLSLMFNTTLNQGMAGRTGIIPVNVFGLVNEVLANPGAYGFSNTTGMACSTGPGVGGAPSSVACGPAGSGLPYTYASGTNQSYFFADGVHPTGAAHALLAQAVVSEIVAPSYTSMLAEAPLQVFDIQNRAIRGQMQADMSDRTDGSLRSFASYDYSHQSFDATATSPRMTNNSNSLVIGADYNVNSAITVGMSTTFSHQDASFGNGGGFQNNEPMGAAWVVWHTPDWYVSALGSAGQLNFNGINRVIQLGTATRVESGSTSGSHLGGELAGGYWFHFDDLKTGPFASVSHQRVHVGSYFENGSDSLTMDFGAQTRNSTIWRLGWDLTGDAKAFGGTFHPFARVAYNHETDNGPRLVSAGLIGLNGTFSMPGYQPDSSYWTGQVGIAAELGGNFSGFASYDGHFGDSSQRIDSFNVGVKWSW